MDLKKHISFQWKVFLPMVVFLWIVIIGTLLWQIDRVRNVRDDMMYEQLSMVGSAMAELSEMQDSTGLERMANFAGKYFRSDEHYDPLSIWIMDMNTDTLVKRYGYSINADYIMPKEKQGTITIEADKLNPDFDEDTRFIYTMHAAPLSDKRIYVLHNYTKHMQEMMDANFTNFWLIFIVIGLLTTLVVYVTTSYFGKNLKLLRNFVYEASKNPNFILTDDVPLPKNELGDITRQIIDLYTQRNTESKLRESEQSMTHSVLEQNTKIKYELTGNINHELKTPIGVIKGLVDTLVANPDMPEEQRKKFMLNMKNHTDRITNLIDDLTAISKLDGIGKFPNTVAIDFNTFITTFVNYLEISRTLRDKMTFSYELPSHCVVEANESLLQTVLLNFVKNSVAYSEGTMCKLIVTKEDSDFYYFAYYDNGVGVPPEHLPRMFERFYRVNVGRSRNLGGTGLGLSIVQNAIIAFGGDVSVQNHFPSGLEFNFTLPKYKGEKSE